MESIGQRAMSVLRNFRLDGDPVSAVPYGSGHINDTLLVTVRRGGADAPLYILQRINSRIFKDIPALMENIVSVTSYLQQAALRSEPGRWKTLTLVPTNDGGMYYTDAAGDCWRVYIFVENTVSYDLPESPEMFYDAALAFGKFVELLASFPAATLHETLPAFHDTANRVRQLERSIDADALGRRSGIGADIDFALARKGQASALTGLCADGTLPLRVTHNDAKLNNVLFDAATGRSVCVIDLDTVMPGLLAFDFGDAIRFGANTAAEDDPNLDNCTLDLLLFERYVTGFMHYNAATVTEAELLSLPMGAKLMTFECGIRFLADYLDGDVYFKTSRPGHNLDRARNQFKLVWDMEQKWGQMQAIVERAAGSMHNS